MDMINIRRRMLLMMGVSNVIGEFSKYQKLIITPSDGNEIASSHNLGTIPKLIIVNGNVITLGDFVSHVICDRDIGVGFSTGRTQSIWSVDITQIKHTSGLIIYMSDAEFVIRRQGSNRLYDTAGTYTVEIYG